MRPQKVVQSAKELHSYNISGDQATLETNQENTSGVERIPAPIIVCEIKVVRKSWNVEITYINWSPFKSKRHQRALLGPTLVWLKIEELTVAVATFCEEGRRGVRWRSGTSKRSIEVRFYPLVQYSAILLQNVTSVPWKAQQCERT